MGITCFYEVELQNKSQTQTTATWYGKQHFFKKDIFKTLTERKKRSTEISMIKYQQKVLFYSFDTTHIS